MIHANASIYLDYRIILLAIDDNPRVEKEAFAWWQGGLSNID